MSSVNVLHVLNDVSDSSISRIVLRMIQNLDQQYLKWHVGGLNGLGDLEYEFREQGTQVVDFFEIQNGRSNLLKSIREYIIFNRIDIVHTHTLRAIFIIAQALGIKSETLHVATKHTLFNPIDRNWGLQYTLFDKLGLYLPNHVVAVSNTMFKQISSYPGMKNRVSVICNDILCESFYKPNQREACRKELGLSLESIVIGYTGRIERVKRIDLLLLSFSSLLKRYPNARLVIAGEGDLKPKLERYAVQLGIVDEVIWTGFRKDIPRILAAMDIFVQTSVNEGLPLSILEAMAAEKAIVATKVGGTKELLENGKTGLLIAPRNVLSIENAILDLMEQPELRIKMAVAARNFVLSHFNAGRMADEYKNLYRTLIAKKIN